MVCPISWPASTKRYPIVAPITMRKTVSVFSHDCNPAIDPPIFFITRHDAEWRTERGFVRPLNPRSVQLKPPPGWTPPDTDYSGLFDKVWQPRFSAHFLVWQMRPTLSESEIP